jgi:hypothetical protein
MTWNEFKDLFPQSSNAATSEVRWGLSAVERWIDIIETKMMFGKKLKDVALESGIEAGVFSLVCPSGEEGNSAFHKRPVFIEYQHWVALVMIPWKYKELLLGWLCDQFVDDVNNLQFLPVISFTYRTADSDANGKSTRKIEQARNQQSD